MAPRANWKGFLRLSLVTCPVALYPATSDSEKISFNQINRNTGHRIKYMKVDSDTGEEVSNEDIMKGLSSRSRRQRVQCRRRKSWSYEGADVPGMSRPRRAFKGPGCTKHRRANRAIHRRTAASVQIRYAKERRDVGDCSVFV